MLSRFEMHRLAARSALRRHRGRWALSAFVLAAALLGGRGAAAEEPYVGGHAVADPYFGVSLFDYFQEHYFSALGDLMVAKQLGRLSHSTDEAEVLRGGLLLSYGLDLEAGRIFTRLADSGASPLVRDRAWYYLAKIRYQKGSPADAEAALGRIKGPLPPGLEEDRILLLGNLLMARGAFAPAAAVLKPLADETDGPSYARYNLGIALIRSGSVARGSEILDELGVARADTEELRTLRDKANVALGFAALQNKDPERARFYLERVRLTSMESSRALLGFGWAADQMIDPKAALLAWEELADRDTSDPAVLEAKLAVPYALSEIGSNAKSLEYYGRAVAAYEQEGANIDESIAAVRSGKFLDDLVERNPGEEMGWFWKIDRLPQMPHPGHLASVLAQHPFQEAFKTYRDLRYVSRTLQDWDGKLAVMDGMLAERREAFARRLPQIVVNQQNAGVGRLDARRDDLVTLLGAAQEQADGVAFADAREKSLATRLERARKNLEALEAGAGSGAPAAPGPAGTGAGEDVDLVAARDRLRRVAGALTWNLAQEFPGRMWDAKKSLQQLNEALQSLHLREADLISAQATEPRRFDALAERIVALRARITAMRPKVAELVALQQLAVEDLAVAQLRQQRELLVDYSNQARFAIAEIYDRATIARDATHARPK
jgi:hypothetical protein